MNLIIKKKIISQVYDREDILFEYDGFNNITARYTPGPGIDDLIGMERGGQSYFYDTDGLGSITQITDSSKQTVASYGYDAFGNITSQNGSLTNSYIGFAAGAGWGLSGYIIYSFWHETGCIVPSDVLSIYKGLF